MWGPAKPQLDAEAHGKCGYCEALARATAHCDVEHIRPKDGSTSERQEIRDTLAERVGPRIYSRLREMCDFITVGGPDRREHEGAAGQT